MNRKLKHKIAHKELPISKFKLIKLLVVQLVSLLQSLPWHLTLSPFEQLQQRWQS